MPYIEPQLRTKIDEMVDEIVSMIRLPGMLNYVLTRIFHCLLRDSSVRYEALRNIMGDIECAKLELFRMVAAPYENKKARENGLIGVLDIEGKWSGAIPLKVEGDD